MGAVSFSHNILGTLTIDNGLTTAQWGYNLNTATFPTYGGEVVQILSVYINDLMIGGTCATYRQIESIYSFFAGYLQTATQGKTGRPNIGDSTKGVAYNLYPVTLSYPERGWKFQIYPQNVPGFRYGREVVAPTWQLSAFVIDDSPDLALIKDGLKALATNKLVDGSTLGLNGEISPQSGNPDTDPFETYTQGLSQQSQTIMKYADYYNSLLPAYQQGDFSALTAAVGSKPAFGQTTNQGSTSQTNSTVTVKPPKKKK